MSAPVSETCGMKQRVQSLQPALMAALSQHYTWQSLSHPWDLGTVLGQGEKGDVEALRPSNGSKHLNVTTAAFKHSVSIGVR